MKRPSRVELVCEVCEKSVMLPPSVIAQGRRCCSARCQGIYKRRTVSYVCIGCGITVETSASLAKKRKYCSQECLNEHKKARIVCEVCGKERKVTPTVIKQGARFCSWTCARQVLNAPRPIVICEQCGKECAVPPSRVRHGMRFCSSSCRSTWSVMQQGRHTSTTNIEEILYRTLDYLKVDYIKQHPITKARTIVDVYVPSMHMALYADGDYWHSLPKNVERDQRQNVKLIELGYKFVRLSGKDLLKNPLEIISTALGM